MTDNTKGKYSYGARPDSKDPRDFVLADTLELLSKELKKLQQEGVYLGIWKPQRNICGQPTNYQVNVWPLDPKVNNQNRIAENDVIIPLKPSITPLIKGQAINLQLPTQYSLYKGYFLRAWAFDGVNDYLRYDQVENINFDCRNNFTIELWVQVFLPQFDLRAEYNSILEKWESVGGYPYAIRYNNVTGKIFACRYDHHVMPDQHQPTLTSRSVINDGEFHHVAFVKRGEHLYLYIDGNEEDRTIDTTHQSTVAHKTQNQDRLHLGCRNGNSHFFKGKICEVRIWNKARTVSQIQEYMTKILKQSEYLELVGHWSCQKEYQTLSQASDSSFNETNNFEKKPELSQPSLVDFDHWSKIKDQNSLRSCTAHAGIALLEYFSRKSSTNPSIINQDYSHKFLYYNAHKLAMSSSNSRAISVREVMASMASLGNIPLKYEDDFLSRANREEDFIANSTKEPDNFCYAIAQKYKLSSYFNLNRPKMDKWDLLDQIKIFIYAGFPPVFTFQAYEEAINHASNHKGKICFPWKSVNDRENKNYHAVVAVGYDDNKKIKVENINYSQSWSDEIKKRFPNNYERLITFDQQKIMTTGAFRIRNSWGPEWGKNGYGWLPYAYVIADLTYDWWSMLKAEWFDTDYFGLDYPGKDTGKPCCSKAPLLEEPDCISKC